ncbi:cadmium resistance transporter [Streptomyces sp. NPDC001194]|uniref:cadmium resistance transporter n=1 Tax=Streptomyces sp. NPDC001194 TaxID=3364547 RepID=UPI00368A9451
MSASVLILALFFAQGAGHRGSTRKIVLGQYLGFTAILAVAVAVAAAFGAPFLPESAIPYLGLLPLALGLKAAWQAWKHRNEDGDDDGEAPQGGPTTMAVAAVTFANGGDNIGVYVPVFATAGIGLRAGSVHLPRLSVQLAGHSGGPTGIGALDRPPGFEPYLRSAGRRGGRRGARTAPSAVPTPVQLPMPKCTYRGSTLRRSKPPWRV